MCRCEERCGPVQRGVDGGRKILRLIEIVCAYGFARVIAQLLPRIALREDRFREAIRAETAVGFLGNLENQLAHGLNSSP